MQSICQIGPDRTSKTLLWLKHGSRPALNCCLSDIICTFQVNGRTCTSVEYYTIYTKPAFSIKFAVWLGFTRSNVLSN